jgi:hypothetical protein
MKRYFAVSKFIVRRSLRFRIQKNLSDRISPRRDAISTLLMNESDTLKTFSNNQLTVFNENKSEEFFAAIQEEYSRP